MRTPQVQQLPIPEELFARLVEYTGDPNDSEAMRQNIENDGYVFLRSVLNRDEVLTARQEVFERLEQVGEVKPPAIDGIATGESKRKEATGDLHTFWKSVNEGDKLRHVTHGDRLRELIGVIFGEAARAHDLMYLRPVVAGRSTKLHYDFPFFARRSLRIHTAWIPFGDAPLSDGPLMIVEGSNRFTDLIDPIQNHDYESDHEDAVIQKAAYERPNETDPITFARQRGVRLLSTDFRAGDLIVFGGFTLHGSLDNCSPIERVRLSCDVRYQPAADPFDDERYFGEDPSGSHGGGYGDMKGAKPLTEPW
jgi:ectoine hydroxylase-related dioxygenase (phytanoyl-CoA dioxygenase family)